MADKNSDDAPGFFTGIAIAIMVVLIFGKTGGWVLGDEHMFVDTEPRIVSRVTIH